MTQYPKISLLVDGEWIDTSDHLEVVNPADQAVIGRVPIAGTSELERAVEAAERGFRAWRRTPPAERASIMMSAAQLLRERIDKIATVMTLEQGKTRREARLEVLRAADIIDWDAAEGRRLYGRVIPAGSGMQHIVYREPIGVVAAFSPWNFPLNAPARKVAGALAAGCALILKASEETPGSAFLLAEAFHDAGLPGGVLNLVFGNPGEISSYLIRHPVVRLISLTGSAAVGRQLATLAAEGVKPAILELGGHAPVIVCADADPIQAARIAIAGKSRNAGQVCVSPTRFFVEEPVYKRFVDEFSRLASGIKLGDGLAHDTDMGPLANQRRVASISAMATDCVIKGARLVAGGERRHGPGNFYPLTVFADVPGNAIAMQEEPFGPLALIVPVRDLDEAIKQANALPYGLAAYAFTDRASSVAQISEEVQCGNIAINHVTASFAETPFGGVKESGYGREGGSEGLQYYTTAKLVSNKIILK